MTDLMTLPGMTEDTARRLRAFGVPNRAALHENIVYQPKALAYAADVSMTRVLAWLGELEKVAVA
jgi:hypothetical protein